MQRKEEGNQEFISNSILLPNQVPSPDEEEGKEESGFEKVRDGNDGSDCGEAETLAEQLPSAKSADFSKAKGSSGLPGWQRSFRHMGVVLTCCFSPDPDGRYVAAGGTDNKLTIRDVGSGAEVWAQQHAVSVLTCCFSPDGRYVAAGGKDKKLTIRDMESKNIAWSCTLPDYAFCCSFIPLHTQSDPAGPIREADCVVVSYGNRVLMLDISCVPLPEECVKYKVSCCAVRRPGFMYRRNQNGQTLLHLVAAKDELFEAHFPSDNDAPEDFRWVPAVYSPKKELKATPSSSRLFFCRRFCCPKAASAGSASTPPGETPLDVALSAHKYKIAQVLLQKYLKNLDFLSWQLLQPSVGLLFELGYTDLISDLLKSSLLDWGGTDSRAIAKAKVGGAQLRAEISQWSEEVDDSSVTEVDVKFSGIEFAWDLFDKTMQYQLPGQTVTFFDQDKSGEVLKFAVMFKWNTYGKIIHSLMLSVFLVLCGLYGTLVAVGSTFASSPNSAQPALGKAALVLSSLFLLHEMLQVVSLGPKRFLSSVWNWVDVLAHLAVMATVVVDQFFHPTSAVYTVKLRVACGWTLVLLSVVIIGMLRPYKPTGALVRMLTRIIIDIKWFMLLQIILLGGFLGALMVMVEDGGKKDGSLLAPLSLLTGFVMMLGDWDTEELHKNQVLLAQLSAVIAFVVYALVVVVVCMNTLIAIMGDSYDRIKEKEVAEGLLQKAEVLHDIDKVFGGLLRKLDDPNSRVGRLLQRLWRCCCWSKRRAGLCLRRLKCGPCRRNQANTAAEGGEGPGGGTESEKEAEEEETEVQVQHKSRFYPRYLKVMQPRDMANRDPEGQWQGKIKALEKSFEKQLKQELEQQGEELKTFKKQLKQELKQQGEEIKTVKEQLKHQEAQLRQILEILTAKR